MRRLKSLPPNGPCASRMYRHSTPPVSRRPPHACRRKGIRSRKSVSTSLVSDTFCMRSPHESPYESQYLGGVARLRVGRVQLVVLAEVDHVQVQQPQLTAHTQPQATPGPLRPQTVNADKVYLVVRSGGSWGHLGTLPKSLLSDRSSVFSFASCVRLRGA